MLQMLFLVTYYTLLVRKIMTILLSPSRLQWLWHRSQSFLLAGHHCIGHSAKLYTRTASLSHVQARWVMGYPVGFFSRSLNRCFRVSGMQPSMSAAYFF